ncbi:MAG: AI-2E family transporter [Cereibacter sphaeroides]|uniref:AI-2E family transporter n=1 Tax=Cereibacter sphaeroides TaxID=1063 RepID=A0A2W5SL62_CERSP|nr:MAG: AI-2E family transporter [Cereibacter sphaeroides]
MPDTAPPVSNALQPTSRGGLFESAPVIRRITLSGLAAIAAVAAVLYFAQDVFLPLAIAMLLTFALSPLVTRLRRLGLSHLPSVLIVVTATFIAMSLFFLVVAGQLSQLATNLPTFQKNILTKVETLQQASSGDGILHRFTKMITEVNTQISAAVAVPPDAASTAAATPAQPLPVQVVENQSPFTLFMELVLPLVSPIATTGLVVVVVIFMLLEREQLRDRFIRLVGSNDLHRTTQVLREAGQRVGQYLLVQLLVNTIYAVPIAVGLYFIGVPQALLWGMLTLVLRFVPYIGSVLAAAFPLFLAFAVSPDWSAVLWTIALFAAVELVTSNVIEPYLYGSRTGVSPLAIIIAAIFWTWIWGPLGLVLSTPLTVCLVVLGRHVPQFELFDILFGDEPVLAPHARLYQRLLSGDAVETTFRAEEQLEEMYLADYYRDVGIPALMIAQNDLARGVLTSEQEAQVVAVGMKMVDNLSDTVTEELDELRGGKVVQTGGDGQTGGPAGILQNSHPDGEGYRVLCIGGRSSLDDLAAAMLAQAMAAEGAVAARLSHGDLAPSQFRALDPGSNNCIVLSFLDPSPSRASLLHIRRIKRAAPGVRVGVVIWEMPKGLEEGVDISRRVITVSRDKLAEAEAIGADFAVTDLEAALAETFSEKTARPLVQPDKTRSRSRNRLVQPA